jgi:hypothetical protein
MFANWKTLLNARLILTRGRSLEAPLTELRKTSTEESKRAVTNHEDIARIVKETINALHGNNGFGNERARKQRDAIVRALTETKGRVGGTDGAAVRLHDLAGRLHSRYTLLVLAYVRC